MSDANTTSHVLITGAAGALGRAVAQHFIDQGARLALVDHHAGRLAEVFPGLDNSHHLLLAGDVTSTSEMAALAEQCTLLGGKRARVNGTWNKVRLPTEWPCFDVRGVG